MTNPENGSSGINPVPEKTTPYTKTVKWVIAVNRIRSDLKQQIDVTAADLIKAIRPRDRMDELDDQLAVCTSFDKTPGFAAQSYKRRLKEEMQKLHAKFKEQKREE